MNDFIIISDTTCDLPSSYVADNNISIIPLCYTINNETYGSEKNLPFHDFYELMRQQIMPSTMACNPQTCEDTFRAHLNQGKDILCIAFSSALSSSCDTCLRIANSLKAEYPNNKIYVIDSLCASLGEGLLVHKAVQQKKAGQSIDDIVSWLETNKLHLCHQFTVDDLHHLHRGGRVSKATAIIGTMINVKPVLHVDNLGRLVPLNNVRGRKKSLTSLVDNMQAAFSGYEAENDIVFIGHGDCLDDAEYVASLIRERFGINNIMIDYITPTIGAHSGPGTVALFYMGSSR